MTQPEKTTNAWTVLRESGHRPRFFVLCLGIWLQGVNTTLVSTLLPSAVPEIGGAHLVGWAFTVYLVGSIIAGAATALTVRRFGLQRCLVGAAALYTVGCSIAAISNTMPMLLCARIIQGSGGGWIVGLTFVAVNRLFPNEILPRLMSMISVMWSLAAFTGPLVGGTFATYVSWRYAFWAFGFQGVLFGLLAFATMGGLSVPQLTKPPRFPIRRLAVLASSILLVALSGTTVHMVWTPVCLIGAVALMVLFLKLDGRHDESRMLPPHPLSQKSATGAGLCMIFLLGVATMSYAVFGPFLMVLLHGASPLMAGYMVAIESVSWGIMAVLVGGASVRWEPTFIRIGGAMVLAGTVWMVFAVPAGPLLFIAPGAFLAGGGFGIMWGFVTRRLIAAAPLDERDRTAGAIPAVQQTSYAVAGALAGLVANWAGFSDTMDRATAEHVAFWVFAAFVPLCVWGWLMAMKVARA